MAGNASGSNSNPPAEPSAEEKQKAEEAKAAQAQKEADEKAAADKAEQEAADKAAADKTAEEEAAAVAAKVKADKEAKKAEAKAATGANKPPAPLEEDTTAGAEPTPPAESGDTPKRQPSAASRPRPATDKRSRANDLDVLIGRMDDELYEAFVAGRTLNSDGVDESTGFDLRIMNNAKLDAIRVQMRAEGYQI